MPLLTPLHICPCQIKHLHGCYWHLDNVDTLTPWLVAYGFRLQHATALHKGNIPVLCGKPLPLEWTLDDWIYWCIDQEIRPYVVTVEDENGRSLTLYPEPGAGTLIRPNDNAARELLAEVAR